MRPATVRKVTPNEHKDYSATPLARKLGLREGSRGLVVALLFTRTQADLRRRLPALARALDPAGRLWVAWPKMAADVESDLTFAIVQGHGLDAGLVDNKSASIDDVYQGLQFVYRLKDRPKRTPDPAS
jgi:hypothetical protein